MSIALSGIFPEEHSRKTDQLVLSSPKGRKNLYWAKLSAGISYASGAVASLFLVSLTITFALFGSEGFDAAFQLKYYRSSDAISCGQALLIAYDIMLITVVLISVLVMILSEIFHSNIVAMAISSGILILSMFLNIPSYYRIPAQIYEWFPAFLPEYREKRLYHFSCAGYRRLSLSGLAVWEHLVLQVAPIHQVLNFITSKTESMLDIFLNFAIMKIRKANFPSEGRFP